MEALKVTMESRPVTIRWDGDRRFVRLERLAWSDEPVTMVRGFDGNRSLNDMRGAQMSKSDPESPNVKRAVALERHAAATLGLAMLLDTGGRAAVLAKDRNAPPIGGTDPTAIRQWWVVGAGPEAIELGIDTTTGAPALLRYRAQTVDEPGAASRETTRELRISGHRRFGRSLLPTVLELHQEGKLRERLEFEVIRLNPAFAAADFAG